MPVEVGMYGTSVTAAYRQAAAQRLTPRHKGMETWEHACTYHPGMNHTAYRGKPQRQREIYGKQGARGATHAARLLPPTSPAQQFRHQPCGTHTAYLHTVTATRSPKCAPKQSQTCGPARDGTKPPLTAACTPCAPL